MLGVGVYIFAWIVIINFLMRHWLAHHADNPAASGLAVLV